jgi:hypothetical protein
MPILKTKLDEKADRSKYIANTLSDAGTGILNAVKTFGMSAVGDAIHGVSPKAADFVQKYSAGMIPHTSEEEYEANRSDTQGAWNNRLGSASSAATNVMAGEMIGPALQKAKTAATPIVNAAKTKVLQAGQKGVNKLITNATSGKSMINYLGENQRAAALDHLTGVSNGLYDLGKGRPFFETFPITEGQRKVVMAKQDEAVVRGKDFIKKWFYDKDGVMRPQARYRLDDAADPMVKQLSDNNYALKDVKNPLNNPEVILYNNRTKGITNIPSATDNIKSGLLADRHKIGGRNVDGTSYVQRNSGFHFRTPIDIQNTTIHELGHNSQRLGYDITGQTYGERIAMEGSGYYVPNKNTPVGRELAKVTTPVAKDAEGKEISTWAASPKEPHAELMVARKNYIAKRLRGASKADRPFLENKLIEDLQAPSMEAIDEMITNQNLRRFFKKDASDRDIHKIIRFMPGVAAAAGIGTAMKKKQGGLLRRK